MEFLRDSCRRYGSMCGSNWVELKHVKMLFILFFFYKINFISLFTMYLDSPLWAPGYQRCMHQTGEGLSAGHHLHCGTETPPHTPLLCWQVWKGERSVFKQFFLKCILMSLCSPALTHVFIFILCRLGRVGIFLQGPQWTPASLIPLSLTSTCAAMQAYR